MDMATHRLVQAHAVDFLKKAAREKQRFDLAVVDPPSYSTTKTRNVAFDIARDHPRLLKAVVACFGRVPPSSSPPTISDFEPRMDGLAVANVKEITASTIPEDYASKRKTIHRCWRITV
jgi:23S rRNA (cytosine1962-C5)-methyltransferase